MKRCKWTATIKDEEYLEYHDKEWSGAPLTKDRDLFELLCLEGAQAGLSWQTILKKRKNYRKVFKNFDIESVVKMNAGDIDMTGIVKHHGKVKSVIENALSAQIVIEGPSTVSPASVRISKDLKKRGFSFVGPTTIQAFLQASGLYRAHDDGCFKYVSQT